MVDYSEISAGIDCHDLIATGSCGRFRAGGQDPIRVHGSIAFDQGMGGSPSVNLLGSGPQTISGCGFGTIAEFDVQTIRIDGTGHYSIQNDCTNRSVYVKANKGAFDTNNFNLDLLAIDFGDPDFGAFICGSSKISVAFLGDREGGSFGMDSGTSTITVRGLVNDAGGEGSPYYNLVFGGRIILSEFNTIALNGLTFSPGSDVTTSADDQYITAPTIACTGTADAYIALHGGTLIGGRNVDCDYLQVGNNTCKTNGGPDYWPTPGATPCVAGIHGIDLGTTHGWLFPASPPNPPLTHTFTPTLTPTIADTATVTS